MESVNKKHLNESEILEIVNNYSDSICSESSVELPGDDSDADMLNCDTNKISGKLQFTFLYLFIQFT